MHPAKLPGCRFKLAQGKCAEVSVLKEALTRNSVSANCSRILRERPETLTAKQTKTIDLPTLPAFWVDPQMYRSACEAEKQISSDSY